jgi:GTPase KRas protein
MRVGNVCESLTFHEDRYMRSGQAFLLVYDITRRSSFDELESFREQILRVKDADWVPMVLLGLDCDLTKVNLDRK